MGILGFLNNLKTTNKNIIGIFVSSKSVLEIAMIDIKTEKVLKHGKIEMPYDIVTRQISQTPLLEASIIKLFENLNIPLNSSVVISLPTVLMGHQTLPVQLDNEEIKTALISEVERNYIFKRYEPVVSWEQVAINDDSNSQYLTYSAIQKEQVDYIEETAKKIGLDLVAVDSSYASLLRGLSITEISKEDIEADKLWCVIVITINSFVVITMSGNKLIDINEDPLAVKSFNPEDIYPNIASYSMENINSKNPEHIIIISESNDVSAEILSTYFDLTCKVSFIEENNFNKIPLFSGNISKAPDNSENISLETVGAAYWNSANVSLNLNFLEKENASYNFGETVVFMGKQFNLTSQLIEYGLLGLITFCFIALTGIYLICMSINAGIEKSLIERQQELGKMQQAVNEQSKAAQQSVKTNASDIISSVYDKNEKLLQSYNAIGEVIPEKLWVENFELHDNLNTIINGKAYSVEDIVNYYQNLVKTAKFENFKISSIKTAEQDASNSNTNSNTDVTINSGKESASLPGLSSVSSQKYYTFSFGNSTASTASTPPATPPAPSSASPTVPPGHTPLPLPPS